MKRKAQMEIAGLLVIVVLVSLVLMFVLTFNVSEREDRNTPQQKTKESQIRDNFGPVLLETTTQDCHGKTIRDLLADCDTVNEIECPGAESTSCAYAKDAIKIIIKETLDKQGFDYFMSVRRKVGGEQKIIASEDMFFENNCDPKSSGTIPSIIPFETDHGTMTLVLIQCS